MSKTKYGVIDMEKQTLDSINNNIMDNIDSLKEQNENHQNTIISLEIQLKKYENMDKHTMSENDFLTIFEIKQKIKEKKDLIEHNNSLEYTYFFDTGSKLFKYYAKSDKEVEEDIKNIRYRIIKMFYQNFKGKDRMRPDDQFPRMYFFKEQHQDGQYHIHLVIESIEPDLLAQSLDKGSFLLRYYTIRQKIINRKDLIITKKMIDRWDEYKHHSLVGRTYDSISEYDDWMVSRFICE